MPLTCPPPLAFAPGGQACLGCAAGTYGPAGSCAACPPGTLCPGLTEAPLFNFSSAWPALRRLATGAAQPACRQPGTYTSEASAAAAPSSLFGPMPVTIVGLAGIATVGMLLAVSFYICECLLTRTCAHNSATPTLSSVLPLFLLYLYNPLPGLVGGANTAHSSARRLLQAAQKARIKAALFSVLQSADLFTRPYSARLADMRKAPEADHEVDLKRSPLGGAFTLIGITSVGVLAAALVLLRNADNVLVQSSFSVVKGKELADYGACGY